MRVITGLYKGRHFNIPRTFKARPTTDFAKENIFNVLQGFLDFENIKALDLYAGTGSISLELLSRGCASVVSVEKDKEHSSFIANCIKKIGVTNHILVCADVCRFILKSKEKFDFIFADPPYSLDILSDIPQMIFDTNLLSINGILVFEHGCNNDFSFHPNFLEHRTYGSVNFSIFQNKK